jgi:hypothetical protein
MPAAGAVNADLFLLLGSSWKKKKQIDENHTQQAIGHGHGLLEMQISVYFMLRGGEIGCSVFRLTKSRSNLC